MEVLCSLSISHTVAVPSNLWIIPSNPNTITSTIKIICPIKAMSTVPLQQPFHTLKLSPACSATARYFHLPLHYEDQLQWWMHLWILQILMQLTSQPLILGYGNISTVTGHHPTCRNGLMYLKFQSHSSTNIWFNTSEPVHSFTIKDDDKDPSLIWTILMHPGT